MRSGVTLSMIADGDSFITSSGNREHVIYAPRFDENTRQIVLVEDARIDISQVINSYAETTDMTYIMARLAAGDASVLRVKSGFYGDVSGLAPDHRAAMQTICDAKVYFDNLSADTRAKFDNNFVSWVSSAGAPDWINKMKPVDVNASLKEVSVDEQKH